MSGEIQLPILDETRCTGCGDCVRVCPVDCLALRSPLPWLVRPLDCISCAACVLICPASALAFSCNLVTGNV